MQNEKSNTSTPQSLPGMGNIRHTGQSIGGVLSVSLQDTQERTISTLMNNQEAVTWKRQVGSAANELRRLLAEGYEREAWRALGYASWSECVEHIAEEYQFGRTYLMRLHSANKNQNLVAPGLPAQIPERQLRPLSKLDTDDDKREVWRIANETAPNGKMTGQHVARTVEEYQRPQAQPKEKNYITLTEWNNGERLHNFSSRATMNRVNENIEWAAWSWNPVTGCLHNCAYCYARDIANRFYPQEFQPSFIPERLSMPENTRPIPPRWEGDTGHNNVFTCSMADLFGKWVPAEWINATLETIERNPKWTFLLLTKFPIRMAEFDYPPNVWLGTSVDKQWAVDRAETAFKKIKSSGFDGVCWLSCEPMLERLTFTSLTMFDWVVMGGSSKSSKTPEYRPPFDDVIHLYQQARRANCKVYMKTNLLGRLREYPE